MNSEEKTIITIHANVVDDIKQIINNGRATAYASVNSTMIATYWNIGRRIVEEEQHGKERAEYGSELIKMLAKELTHEYGSGFSERYLAYFRKFYVTIPDLQILQTRLQNLSFSERDMESSIISHLKDFLMEMGRGFAFVARQQHIRTDAEDYFIDLVFYNVVLKCYVLVDLKVGKITHQDVGQMDMYVRMYDELKRTEGDNPTIGIVLCSETDSDIARYSILKGNEQIFATKYKLYLPTEEELRREIERQKELFLLQYQK